MQTQTFNIYCDESCHLERDRQCAMVLGATWCPILEASRIAAEIRELKKKHHMPKHFEIKWTGVAPSKSGFYHDLMDYFFDESDLHFRALIVPNKSAVKFSEPPRDHDTWYYKMYFDMLKVLLSPRQKYRVYLDIKDTRGASKVRKLHEVLCNAQYDFKREIIEWVQIVRSHEIEQVQLADLLIGCVGYVNRSQQGSKTKLSLVEKMKQRSGYDLTRSTLLREQKVNLFRWSKEAES